MCPRMGRNTNQPIHRDAAHASGSVLLPPPRKRESSGHCAHVLVFAPSRNGGGPLLDLSTMVHPRGSQGHSNLYERRWSRRQVTANLNVFARGASGSRAAFGKPSNHGRVAASQEPPSEPYDRRAGPERLHRARKQFSGCRKMLMRIASPQGMRLSEEGSAVERGRSTADHRDGLDGRSEIAVAAVAHDSRQPHLQYGPITAQY